MLATHDSLAVSHIPVEQDENQNMNQNIGFNSENLIVSNANPNSGYQDSQSLENSLTAEPDRTSEDFVIVSLCIADPTDWLDDALGTSGHAFLRLQCPYYSLDYCFSYEGESVNDNLWRYISGSTKMGMFAIPTFEYLQDYHNWNRSVHEYFLDLPPEAETRLWEIMDNHLTNGNALRHDLNKYGCAITVVKYVKQALRGHKIQYAPSELDDMTRREVGYRTMRFYPWLRLTGMMFISNNNDLECPLDEKLTVPADLATVWQEATVDGRRLATYKGDIVIGASLNNREPWFTPLLMAWLLLIITLALACSSVISEKVAKAAKIWDYALLGCQAVAGIAIFVVWVTMKNAGSGALLVMFLLNPLPLICWKWHRYWGGIYAALIAVWATALACMPHMLIDPAFLVLSLSYIVLFAKDWVVKMIDDVRRKRQ